MPPTMNFLRRRCRSTAGARSELEVGPPAANYAAAQELHQAVTATTTTTITTTTGLREQPEDGVARVAELLQESSARKERATPQAPAGGAATPVQERFSKWADQGCWLLTEGGTMYCGEFADKQVDTCMLTAHMQLVHACGVDPIEIKACGSVATGSGGFGSGARGSMYNVEAARKVMSGMDEAGLDLNSEAARAVMADVTALAGDNEKEVAA